GRLLRDPVLADIAARKGRPLAQIALRWLIQQGNIVPIPRSSNAKRIAENLNVFDFALTDKEMKRIATLKRPDGRIANPAGRAPAWDRDGGSERCRRRRNISCTFRATTGGRRPSSTCSAAPATAAPTSANCTRSDGRSRAKAPRTTRPGSPPASTPPTRSPAPPTAPPHRPLPPPP